MFAKDVMTRDVTSVTPETAIVEAANLLLSKRISSVPVVDESGKLVGIVSEGDLIHRSEIGTGPHHPWWQIFSLGLAEHDAEFLKMHGVRVSHVMTRQVVTAGEDATLGQIVDTFDRFDVNRVPIVRNGDLVGIVSRSDILRLLSGLPRTPGTEARGDDAIRKDLEALLAEAVWATVTSISSSITYEVREGVVYLSGMIGSDRERDTLQIAAETIPGVRGVVADLATVPRDMTAI
jgi:CBS domain-containing protein